MFLKPSKLKFWLKQFGFKPAMQDKFILTIAPVLTKAKTSSVLQKMSSIYLTEFKDKAKISWKTRMVPCKKLFTNTNRVFKINNSRFSRFFQQLCNKRSDVSNSGCWTQFCAHDSWRKLNINIFQKIHWEKETSITLLLSLWFRKHLRNFQCTTRRSWFFMVD